MSQNAVTSSSTAATVHVIIKPPHCFHEMHHCGPDGKHHCPTGFAMCCGEHDPECDEVRNFDGDCRKVGVA